jgi:hypothetical protein
MSLPGSRLRLAGTAATNHMPALGPPADVLPGEQVAPLAVGLALRPGVSGRSELGLALAVFLVAAGILLGLLGSEPRSGFSLPAGTAAVVGTTPSQVGVGVVSREGMAVRAGGAPWAGLALLREAILPPLHFPGASAAPALGGSAREFRLLPSDIVSGERVAVLAVGLRDCSTYAPSLVLPRRDHLNVERIHAGGVSAQVVAVESGGNDLAGQHLVGVPVGGHVDAPASPEEARPRVPVRPELAPVRPARRAVGGLDHFQYADLELGLHAEDYSMERAG